MILNLFRGFFHKRVDKWKKQDGQPINKPSILLCCLIDAEMTFLETYYFKTFSVKQNIYQKSKQYNIFYEQCIFLDLRYKYRDLNNGGEQKMVLNSIRQNPSIKILGIVTYGHRSGALLIDFNNTSYTVSIIRVRSLNFNCLAKQGKKMATYNNLSALAFFK